MDTVINRLRPQASDKEPKRIRLNAKESVATDNDKLATAGEIPKSCVNSGISGCVMYKLAKVINPAENRAKFAN